MWTTRDILTARTVKTEHALLLGTSLAWIYTASQIQ